MKLNDQTLIGIRVFQQLSAEGREVIASQCRVSHYAAHQQIVSQNDDSEDVFFVISGAVRATLYSSAGREVIFQDLDAGDMFGELAAIDSKPRSTSVFALQDSLLAVVSGSAFRGILRQYPAVADATMKRLVELIRQHCERIFEFSTLGVNNRIHAELLRLARQASPGGDSVSITNPPTHADIANRVSTHREAVSRELKNLERIGLLRWNRSEHVICDIQKLEEMVHRVLDSESQSG